ncbi:MAG: MoaD/ThiS family protein [Desulfotomaculales bacterium]
MAKGFITVVLRSHVPPSASIEGFAPGKKIRVRLPEKVTVKDLIRELFSQKENQIGFAAVNGVAAAKDTVLQEGDLVDLFSFIPGG